jgi:hypothetical protein
MSHLDAVAATAMAVVKTSKSCDYIRTYANMHVCISNYER